MVRAAVAVWLLVLALLAGQFALPQPWAAIVWIPYAVA